MGTAILFQVPVAKSIPVALDQQALAGRAPGAAAFPVMHIAGIHIVQAIFESDIAGLDQGSGWRRAFILQLPVGVKRGEMKRHVRTQILHDPLRHFLYLFFRIVLAWNQ